MYFRDLRHNVRQAAKAGAIGALHAFGLAMLASVFTNDRLLVITGPAIVFTMFVLLALAGVDMVDEGRRRSEPPVDPGETLTMLGPVWIEHPEADAVSPPRRFT